MHLNSSIAITLFFFFFLSLFFFILQVSIENGFIFRFDETESSFQTIVILDFEPSEGTIGFTMMYLFLFIYFYVSVIMFGEVIKIKGTFDTIFELVGNLWSKN